MPKATKFCIEGTDCPVQRTLAVIGDKWTVLILHQLMDRGTLRFGELRKVLPGITQKVLTKQLRTLEQDGLVARKVYPEVPPRVEYSLTDLGGTLQSVFRCMASWGIQYADVVADNRKARIMGLVPEPQPAIPRTAKTAEPKVHGTNGTRRNGSKTPVGVG